MCVLTHTLYEHGSNEFWSTVLLICSHRGLILHSLFLEGHGGYRKRHTSYIFLSSFIYTCITHEDMCFHGGPFGLFILSHGFKRSSCRLLIKHSKYISIAWDWSLAKVLQIQKHGTILEVKYTLVSKIQTRNFVRYAKCSEHPHIQTLEKNASHRSEASKPSRLLYLMPFLFSCFPASPHDKWSIIQG